MVAAMVLPAIVSIVESGVSSTSMLFSTTAAPKIATGMAPTVYGAHSTRAATALKTEQLNTVPMGAEHAPVQSAIELASDLPVPLASVESPEAEGRIGPLAQAAFWVGGLGAAAANLFSRRKGNELAMATASGAAAPESQSGKLFGIDLALVAYLAFWYIGNYQYNIVNKNLFLATGGAAGWPMTFAWLQLGVGVIYALFLWAAPDARERPKTTKSDIVALLPLTFTFAASYYSTLYAMSAGPVSFLQIVKALEPVFAAVLSVVFYNKKLRPAKWYCMGVIIIGVILASVAELNFTWAALASGMVANLFAAARSNENKAVMEKEGVADRIGSVGNQFGLTMVMSFLLSAPAVIALEGHRFGALLEAIAVNPAITGGIIGSGLWFYLYMEMSTLVVKKTNAVTQSVANTAKRVIVILGMAVVLGESLSPIKLLGCTIGIGGVFLYSLVDQIFPPKKEEPLVA